MADITSVQLYLRRSGETTTIAYVYFYDASWALLGMSGGVNTSGISQEEPEWVTFTFSPAISISDNAFYGIRVGTPGSPYGSTRIRTYAASDWEEQEYGAEGKECCAQCYKAATGWVGLDSIAYQVNGDVTNGATVTGIENTFSNYQYGYRFKTVLFALTPPEKPINPTPENDDTGVDFSGFQLSWEDGGGADTYNVYMGESGDLTLMSSAQAGVIYTTSLAELETVFESLPINQKVYWRVDATNDAGTTTGDEWNFDARPGKAKIPIPEDGEEEVYIKGIDRLKELKWQAPD